MTQHISVLSAAKHYAVSAQLWEDRAKGLQGSVDELEAQLESANARIQELERTVQELETQAADAMRYPEENSWQDPSASNPESQPLTIGP